MDEDEEDFCIEDLGIEIHCPKCGNELTKDPDTLPLAESPTGAMFDCGKCQEISQWRFTLEPLSIEQVVPITWGGDV